MLNELEKQLRRVILRVQAVGHEKKESIEELFKNKTLPYTEVYKNRERYLNSLLTTIESLEAISEDQELADKMEQINDLLSKNPLEESSTHIPPLKPTRISLGVSDLSLANIEEELAFMFDQRLNQSFSSVEGSFV